MLALERLRQKDLKFEASLGYMWDPVSKNQREKKSSVINLLLNLCSEIFISDIAFNSRMFLFYSFIPLLRFIFFEGGGSIGVWT
jgi:hypothetical protein